jgi:hypothetical protein
MLSFLRSFYISLCNFSDFYDFNWFYYVFCDYERLKPSTKVEDEDSSLINNNILVILFVQL